MDCFMLDSQVLKAIESLEVQPTSEQQTAIAKAIQLESFKIMAYAGTGKTSTLSLISHILADILNKKGLYLAFNKAIAVEAESRFNQNVTCRTFHSLAYSNVPRRLSSKCKNPRNFPKELASKYGLSDMRVPYSKSHLLTLKSRSEKKHKEVMRMGATRYCSAALQMQMINDAVSNFCKSDSKKIGVEHFKKMDWINVNDQLDMAKKLLPIAEKRWEDLIGDNEYNISHDVYVKVWALTEPQIKGFDYIMMDESQDSDGLMSALLKNQKCPVIYVGDANQSIYGWRGAVNTLKELELPSVLLTESFRFGEQIAAHANQVLSLLGETVPLVGNQKVDSKIIIDHERAIKVDAILCRTNKGAFYEFVYQINAFPERKFAFLADITEIKNWITGAKGLISGEKVYHQDLSCFANWSEVIEYTELNRADNEFQSMVRLIDQFDQNFEEIFSVLDMISTDVSTADCVICTVHKAKGLEWDNVAISEDFELSLMTDKFAGVGHQPKTTTIELLNEKKVEEPQPIYLENWDVMDFPSSMKLRPVLGTEMVESRLPILTVLDERMSDQRSRITEMPEEELRLIYVAITRAKKNLYAANFSDFFILLEKLRNDLDN